MGYDYDRLAESVHSTIEKTMEKKINGIERNFADKLRRGSDAQVMAKLRQAQAEDHRFLPTVEKEARRRGLI